MNDDQVKALRAPFPVSAIHVKPQTVTKDKTKALVTFYVDARDVAERLNEAVGAANWSDRYQPLLSGWDQIRAGTPVECSLTVDCVTKTDVGQVVPEQVSRGGEVRPPELDDKSWKSAYSDAFKRAAVKFGVGAYLYDSPGVWAETKVVNDRVMGFSDNGRAQALAAYAKWIGSEERAPAQSAGATKSSQSSSAVGGRGASGAAAAPAAAAPADPYAGDPVTRALVDTLLELSKQYGQNKVETMRMINENREKTAGYLKRHQDWLERCIARVRENIALKQAQAESAFQPPPGATEKAA